MFCCVLTCSCVPLSLEQQEVELSLVEDLLELLDLLESNNNLLSQEEEKILAGKLI